MHSPRPSPSLSSSACSSSSTSSPFTSPLPAPVGRSGAQPPSAHTAAAASSAADCLPFNSFHVAAEYNLYHLKAHLTSPIPLSSLPNRPFAPRYVTPSTLKGRSAPSSACHSDEDDEDSRAAVFTSRAFHSSAGAPSTAPSLSHSASAPLPAGVDGCCLHIPRWYYEDQLRQVVEQMDKATINSKQPHSHTAAATPYSSPITVTTRTVSRTSTLLHRPSSLIVGSQPEQRAAVGQVERPSNKRVRVPTPVPKFAPSANGSGSVRAQLQQTAAVSSKRLASTSEGEWDDKPTREDEADCEKVDDGAGSVSMVSAGMDLRRVKLLEIAKLQQRLDRPLSSMHGLTMDRCQ